MITIYQQRARSAKLVALYISQTAQESDSAHLLPHNILPTRNLHINESYMTSTRVHQAQTQPKPIFTDATQLSHSLIQRISSTCHHNALFIRPGGCTISPVCGKGPTSSRPGGSLVSLCSHSRCDMLRARWLSCFTAARRCATQSSNARDSPELPADRHPSRHAARTTACAHQAARASRH